LSTEGHVRPTRVGEERVEVITRDEGVLIGQRPGTYSEEIRLHFVRGHLLLRTWWCAIPDGMWENFGPPESLTPAETETLRGALNNRCFDAIPEDESAVVRSLVPDQGHEGHAIYHLAKTDDLERYGCACGTTFMFSEGVVGKLLQQKRNTR